MQIQGPAHLHGPQSVSGPHGAAQRPAAAPSHSAAVSDELNISSEGQFLSKIAELPEIRHDRVEAARAAIAEGAYDSEAKLSLAIDRLLDEIG